MQFHKHPMLVCAGTLLVALAMGFLGDACASDDARVRIESSADRTVARIGDAIIYRVTVEFDTTLSVVGVVPEKALAAFDVRDRRAIQGEAEAGRRSVTEEFVLAGYSPGNQWIGARPYLIRSADGRVDTVMTAAIPVEVVSMLPADAEDIRDIKGPAEIPTAFPVWWIVGISAAGVAVAATLVWYIRRRRRRGEVIIVPPPRPSHEVAYEALEELRRQNLPGSGQTKAYYMALSETIRRYLGARFGVPAMDRTTAEMLFLLKKTECRRDVGVSVRELLDTADRAKFARWEGTLEEADDQMKRSFRIVDESKQAWINEPQEEGVAAAGGVH
ncbi:MAG: DUF4381 family protein [Candidatus Eisenbacteria sp.]|nr:DUF4381 family protein [Candidatus Eisenbacteria bacterium]